MSTGLPMLAAAGRNSCSASRVCQAQLRQLETVCLARIGGEDRRPTRVGQDRDASSIGNRLVREQRGHVEHLFQRVRPDDARLPEAALRR